MNINSILKVTFLKYMVLSWFLYQAYSVGGNHAYVTIFFSELWTGRRSENLQTHRKVA